MAYHPDFRSITSNFWNSSSFHLTSRPEDKPDDGSHRTCLETTKDKLIKITRSITIEPSLLLFTISVALGTIMSQSLAMRKYCLIQMGQPDHVCRNLTSNDELEQEAQKYTTDFIMYKTMLDTLPSVLWGIVIGSWSDKHGRKLLFIVPNIGGFISAIIMALNAYMDDKLDVNYILLASVPSVLTGSFVSMMTGSMSYIADITDPSHRTVRFAIVQATLMGGFPIGLSIAGILFKHFGYLVVYITSACLHVVAIVYSICFIKETIHSSLGLKEKFLALFQFNNIKEGIKTVLKNRPNNAKFHLILLITALAISFIPLYAEYNLMYLYTRLKFQWDEVTYTNFSTGVLVVSMFGLTISMRIMSYRLKFKDTTIGIISSLSKIISEIVYALSTQGWMLYAVMPVFLLNGLTSIIIRTMLSKIVSEDEQGKILAVLSAIESATPTIGSVTYAQLYNSTRYSFPGAIYLLGACFAAFPAVALIWMYAMRKNISIPQTSVSKLDLIAEEATNESTQKNEKL